MAEEPNPFHFLWRCLKQFGHECYRTWRAELLASVLVSCVSFGITYRRDPAAWTNLKVALLSSAIVLSAFGLWHLVRSPWLVYKETIRRGPHEPPWAFGVLGIVLLGVMATGGYRVFLSRTNTDLTVTPTLEHSQTPPPSSKASDTSSVARPQHPKMPATPSSHQEQKASGGHSTQQQQQNSGGNNIQQNGQKNIAQIGNDNQATINPDVNPNVTPIIYNCYGDKIDVGPTASASSADNSVIGAQRPALMEMDTLLRSPETGGDQLLARCTKAKGDAPEWLTPYLFCAAANFNLQHIDKAKQELGYFDAHKGNTYATRECEALADAIRAKLSLVKDDQGSPADNTPKRAEPVSPSPQPDHAKGEKPKVSQKQQASGGYNNQEQQSNSGGINTQQTTTSGPNVSAPYGIAIGGNNTGSPTVNNYGPQPLMFDDSAASAIATQLGVLAGHRIKLRAIGNLRSENFQQRLGKALLSAGLSVEGETVTIYENRCGHGAPEGLSWEFSKSRKDDAVAISNTLIGLNLMSKSPYLCPSESPDELTLVINSP